MKAKSGFTLVEILIVVVILGILAAIVIPQFTDASTDAKKSTLKTDLQTVRSAIGLYKIQHSDALPTAGGLSFTNDMTQYTNEAGTTASATPVAGYKGPYLQKIPTNAFDGDDTWKKGKKAQEKGGGWYGKKRKGEGEEKDREKKN